MKSSDIHIRAISHEMLQPSITKICSKITCLKFNSNLPGANELIGCWFVFPSVRHGVIVLVDKMVHMHDNVIKRKHFPRHWSFVCGIHPSPVNSLHKGHWRGALIFSMIYTWINGWVKNREAIDLRRHLAHYDFIVLAKKVFLSSSSLGNIATLSNDVFVVC